MIENLFTTMIGSHIWKMNTPQSDTDLFQVYVASTEDILKGVANTRSEFAHNKANNTDLALYEIGTVITQLIKGNLNFLIGVMSPIEVTINYPSSYRSLQDIVRENISKNCYGSIHGWTIGDYMKYIESGKDDTEFRRNIIVRILKFGERLLRTGEFIFEPVHNSTVEDIRTGIAALNLAYEESSLPEQPNAEPFRNLLYGVRLIEWEYSKRT